MGLRSFEKQQLVSGYLQKLLELRGSIPEPAIQQKHYFDSCQLIKTWMYNIRLQAPKLARKCDIKHWYACGADGRKVDVRSRDCEFSQMDRFSKLWVTSMDRKMSPRYTQVMMVREYSSLTAAN